MLNVSKAKRFFFINRTKWEDIPLSLPKLKINSSETERSECLKFVRILLDKNLCLKKHIKYIESKIAKNLGLLYKAKPYLDKHSLLSLYLSYILSYISYGSIAWESTIRTNLKKYTVSRNMISELYIIKIGCHITLFKECRILIIYQACICKNLLFMHQINSDTIPSIIFNKFNKPTHNYSTNFAKTNYGISPFKLSK